MSKKSIILFSAAVLFSLAALLAGFFPGLADYKPLQELVEKQEKKPLKVTLDFWGVWDNSDSWQPIIDKFESEKHVWNGQEVQVKINYTKKDYGAYETSLKKAYSENASPSIFIINNYWLNRYAASLQPLSGNAAAINEYGLVNYNDLPEMFPPYILQDALHGDNAMYALPTYSDSLALYYNKDLFQKAGIDQAPATWDELKNDAKKLTILGKKNHLKQSAISLGGGKNINRACDIFSLLALQGGSKIIDPQGNIDFNKTININTSAGMVAREPGLNAIRFYMDFSDPDKEVYAWNTELTNSVQDFAEGRTAMMLSYNYQRANLLALKPELNYGIAPVPQLANSTPITISNVWLPVVSNQKSCAIEGNREDVDCAKIAWSFLSFANQKENITQYLNTTGKAAARLDLIEEQSAKDDFTSVFAKQAKIARSYNKFDDKIDAIFSDMLDQIYADRGNLKQKADDAAAKIEELKNKQ